jgi:hypothetical protein
VRVLGGVSGKCFGDRARHTVFQATVLKVGR